MQAGAILQACLDLLHELKEEKKPADELINQYLRKRRYIGSSDRHQITDLFYLIIRTWGHLTWWVHHHKNENSSPKERLYLIACLMLNKKWPLKKVLSLFNDQKFCPPSLTQQEINFAQHLEGQSLDHPKQDQPTQFETPIWIFKHFKKLYPTSYKKELQSLSQEAPFDLRVNILKTSREKLFDMLTKQGLSIQYCPLSPWGLRTNKKFPLAQMDIFKQGLVEVQDEGSQLIAWLVDAQTNMKVLDFCAGAGGKTLALAATMHNKGQVIATDISTKRINRAPQRLRRAGIHNVQCKALKQNDPWIKRHHNFFDRVLIDVPCSGSGTWRRNPEAKWRLTEETLQNLQKLQQQILEKAHMLVKTGGRLIYSTCSLFKDENETILNDFLTHHKNFSVIPIPKIWAKLTKNPCPTHEDFLQLTPAQHHTDGFFIGILEKNC
ncbi:MAG: RsmB/NOP family class I SAM-dependent RNA methyltransferase [Alphaproteobacteria bacterium]|nr:RsmB/NOP family class I SAM-dependent RNA methyltransferase [Alphaproteobacteria bacterium]